MTGDRPLTKKQLDFCLGVVEGKADYVAYMDAYAVTSRKVAEAAAPRLLGNVRIQAKIAELRQSVVDEVIERVAVDKVWVMQHLVKNVQVSMRELPSQVTINETGQRFETFEKYSPSGANKALELIGTELGMFKVRVQDIPWEELEPEDLKQIEKGVLPFKLRKLAS